MDHAPGWAFYIQQLTSCWQQLDEIVASLPPLYRWENWASGKLRLAKPHSWLVVDRSEIQVQHCFAGARVLEVGQWKEVYRVLYEAGVGGKWRGQAVLIQEEWPRWVPENELNRLPANGRMSEGGRGTDRTQGWRCWRGLEGAAGKPNGWCHRGVGVLGSSSQIDLRSHIWMNFSWFIETLIMSNISCTLNCLSKNSLMLCLVST